MNAKLGFLSLLVSALTFLAPLTAQAAPAGIDHPAPPPPSAPVWDPPTGPILAPVPQPSAAPAPDPGDTSQDTSADQPVPAPEAEISPAVEAPSFQWTHSSMDDLAQSMQSLDAPAEAGHYTMDDIAQSGL